MVKFSVYLNRHVFVMRINWAQLLQMENHRYPKQCYLMLKRLDEARKITWASQIKLMLCIFGFGCVWLSQDVGNS